MHSFVCCSSFPCVLLCIESNKFLKSILINKIHKVGRNERKFLGNICFYCGFKQETIPKGENIVNKNFCTLKCSKSN